MRLVIDVGNTQLFAGLFERDALLMQFRRTTQAKSSSDEIGLFLKSVLRENGVTSSEIKTIVIGSVVPNLVHALRAACIKYFTLEPMILQAGIKTGLKIKYRNPIAVGADRIANAVGATGLFPKQNLIIIDFGTATTVCAVSKDKAYLGGWILPGLRLSMEALEQNTACLPAVEIKVPTEVVGRSTIDCIQSGLYFGAVGMMREAISRLRADCFQEGAMVIGTGGFSRLFEPEGLFDAFEPELVLKGLNMIADMNA